MAQLTQGQPERQSGQAPKDVHFGRLCGNEARVSNALIRAALLRQESILLASGEEMTLRSLHDPECSKAAERENDVHAFSGKTTRDVRMSRPPP